ncbi:hypothetical protein IWW34DRAFT_724284 [Fusarium oxysporum f. sp. albedinis]|nr:hypothetical protein IWW34DRAFT_724284 [Fusarium oxysporum f. sp. albedinis]
MLRRLRFYVRTLLYGACIRLLTGEPMQARQAKFPSMRGVCSRLLGFISAFCFTIDLTQIDRSCFLRNLQEEEFLSYTTRIDLLCTCSIKSKSA